MHVMLLKIQPMVMPIGVNLKLQQQQSVINFTSYFFYFYPSQKIISNPKENYEDFA
jgi:hypothetical protein